MANQTNKTVELKRSGAGYYTTGSGTIGDAQVVRVVKGDRSVLGLWLDSGMFVATNDINEATPAVNQRYDEELEKMGWVIRAAKALKEDEKKSVVSVANELVTTYGCNAL